MSKDFTIPVDVDARVKPMHIIPVDEIPWTHFSDPTGWIEDGASLKRLTNPDCSPMLELFQFAPNYIAPSHWHENDTIYIIRRGVFIVEGEGEYKPGDVRWVQGGTAYGSEQAGPDGCEVFLITTGDPGPRDPNKVPPPRGYWHQVRS